MDITNHLKEQKYVAFLDVLGFKELVRTKGEKLNRYFKTIENALIDIESDKKEIILQLVSDSTILACDFTSQNLRLLLRAVQTIQSRCALENIWIRGAITIGDIYFNRDLNIVVGNGLSDAYLLESQEKFPRVIIDPKILKAEYGFGTRKRFIETFNNAQERDRIAPLIHDSLGQNDSIENEAIFVAFAERIIYENINNLDIIYGNIQNELYNSQITYQKYLWLKQYFISSLTKMSYYYENMRHFRLPYDSKTYGKLDAYKSKFVNL
ncbi:hypothetical protein [Flavobacterium selenitireducens]|uniref:hypothetical protein n=1 Tax=Flavobacterium selenitireducens TaxID=2722704 RepID=UPI00168B852D|nr:hypothetical protein [Flavobacterium selenitireducens]MBD3584068.1 hypothetical protein [Flavobacterium selenitireducens]